MGQGFKTPLLHQIFLLPILSYFDWIVFNRKRRGIMEFFLEEPTIERKEDVIDYFNEFNSYHSPVNGSSLFETMLYGSSYEDCLQKVNKLMDQDYAKSINRLPGKTFFLIRKEDNKLIGMINIRYLPSENTNKFLGNIGYSIRPTERRKGYNKTNLYLGLKKAKELGFKKVRLSCEKDNIGSNKTIIALGGILEISDIDPSDQTLTNVYVIDIEKSLNSYQDLYERKLEV